MVLLLLEGLLLAVGMGLVLWPLTRETAGGGEVAGSPSASQAGGLDAERRRVLASLAELEMDYRTGKVSDEDYQRMKDDLLARGTAAAGFGPASERAEEARRRIEAEVGEAVRRRTDGAGPRRDRSTGHRSAGTNGA